MKNDIKGRGDVELMVNTFYNKVQKDDVLNHIFGDVAQTNWETHLPKMYDFWETILFNTASFKGNPMQAHFKNHKKEAFDPQAYVNWIKIFKETVYSLFEGPIADNAVFRAENILNITKFRMNSVFK